MNSPLQNKKVVLTRSREQADRNIEQLRKLGAEVIFIPTIKIVFEEVDSTKFVDINDFDFIIFTSANAAESFHRFIEQNKIIWNSENQIIAATGSKTASKCSELRIKVDLIPEDFSAEGLISKFSEFNLSGKKIFIPASKIARDELKEGLLNLGADVKLIPFYNVVKTDAAEVSVELERVKKEKIDLYIFTSPSTYNNFIELADVKEPAEFFTGSMISSIGPTTAEAIVKSGVQVDLIPNAYTMDSLIESIINHFQNSEILKN